MDGGAGLVTDNALTYGDVLPEGGALLGLDLGTKTIGVATCDAGWRYATAGKTIARGKFTKDTMCARTLDVYNEVLVLEPLA